MTLLYMYVYVVRYHVNTTTCKGVLYDRMSPRVHVWSVCMSGRPAPLKGCKVSGPGGLAQRTQTTRKIATIDSQHDPIFSL